MLPSIIIGLGGTGKWVLTDLKKCILDVNDGEMPDNVVLLALDLEAEGSPRIERSVFKFREGKRDKLTLDYSDNDTPEFYNFSDYWAQPIFDIRNGRGSQREFIYRWLKEDDADSYILSASELHSTDGAGQRRQTSRVSFFLHSDRIYQKIYDAVMEVGGALSGQTMQVFIISSLAGGTGCGIFIDTCYLVYRAVAERGIGTTAVRLYGFFILPRGFGAVAATSADRQLMEGNCFAAFRELQRFMSVTNIPIDYLDGLRGIDTGGVRLFDICYLIDGSKVAGESGSQIVHYRSTCPAMADFILLHITEGMAPTTETRNLVTHIGNQIRVENPFEAQIYSTFGIYRYIFDVEDVKRSFAHRLALETLSHFLEESPKGETEIKSEVQSFMKSPANTPLNRECINYFLEHPGSIKPHKDILFRYMMFNSKDEDIPLPTLLLKNIPTKSLLRRVPFIQVKRAADARINANLGSESDKASPESRAFRSYYGVLNYYLDAHKKKFKKFLKDEVVNILHQDEGKGGLDHAYGFLGLLAETYEDFIEGIKRAFDREEVDEKIRRANQEMDNCQKKDDQKGYLVAATSYAEHRQHALVMEYVIKIAECYKELCKDFQQQISEWSNTFELGRELIRRAMGELNSVRIDKKGVRVHEYVTEPNDRWEKRLYELIFRRTDPKDEVETALDQKLPHPDFPTILRNFNWMFDHPDAGQDKLTCTLPAEFAPWDDLRERPLQWNYNFINNFLEKGQFHTIDNISIMDILAWKGINPDDFARELIRKSAPLSEFSSTEQQRGALGEGDQRVTSDWMKVFAKSVGDEPGRSFVQRLQKRFVDYREHDDSHQIIIYQARHFIRMRGFPNLLSTETTYRSGVNRKEPAPLHIFLAEKNAARYEEKMGEILNEEVRCLHPEVVNLLEHDDWVRDFTYGVLYQIIPRRSVQGRFCYVYEVEIAGEKRQVTLGENLLDAMKGFASDDREAEKVRDEVRKKVVELKDQKASNPEDFAEELKQLFKELRIEGGSLAEEDFIRVMKILLWEEATYYGEQAQR